MRFEDLTAFLDYFADTKQEFYYFPPFENETKDETPQLGTSIFPIYTQACTEFLSVIFQRRIVNYLEVLKNKGVEYNDIEKIDFKVQDDLTILAFLTTITRSMYYGNVCDLGKYASKGIIYKMLYRLQEIDNNEG